jgi:hypothetical protein
MRVRQLYPYACPSTEATASSRRAARIAGLKSWTTASDLERERRVARLAAARSHADPRQRSSISDPYHRKTGLRR